MKLSDLLQNDSSDWIRYTDYTFRKDKRGEEYLAPAEGSTYELVTPSEHAEQMLVDALNIGRTVPDQEFDTEVRKAMVKEFACQYGLLGFMMEYPLSPDILNGKVVYLRKNPLIEKESMKTGAYLKLFLPFDGNINAYTDGKTTAVSSINEIPAMFFMDRPPVYSMVFSRNYAERLSWILDSFSKLYVHFHLCNLYRHSELKEQSKAIMAKLIGGYRLEGVSYRLNMTFEQESPSVMWDFRSLKNAIDTLYGFAISDEKHPLRICKHCGKVFWSNDIRSEFCSPRCRNQFNVYKSRGKK